MDLKDLLCSERADLDQSWAHARDLFVSDIERMVRLWGCLSDRDDLDAVRALPDEDLRLTVVLALLALNELLGRAGSMVAELKADQD